jgi:hypothetical protein
MPWAGGRNQRMFNVIKVFHFRGTFIFACSSEDNMFPG